MVRWIAVAFSMAFKVDALNAEGCALYIDFLELDRREDQQVEKPPGCG
jgi:hypothetical protein